MDRVLLVARNAFRGVISKRALYIWAAAILFMLLRSAPAVLMQDQPAPLLAFVRATAISGSLDLWATLCIGAAIFIGSGAIASEITSKTIVTVLARPIRRWELLVGRWLGLSAFCLVTLAIGVGLALLLAQYLGIEVGWAALGIGATLTAASIVLYGGVAIALSASASAGLAGALTVLLIFMSPLVTLLISDTGRVRHNIGVALDYVVPPGLPPLSGSRYAGVAWAPQPVRPNFRGQPRPPNVQAQAQRPPVIDYVTDRNLAAEALAYASAYFVVGCVVFSRRDIKLG